MINADTLLGARESFARACFAVGLACVATGCSDATGASGLVSDPYKTLELNVRSAVMSTVAPYNTVQLVATPYTALGTVFDDSVESTFTTKDTTLSVTPDGLVTALKATTNTFIVATTRDPVHGVTHVDTMYVVVTNTTPASPLDAFAIRRPAGDSAKIGVYHGALGLYKDTVRVTATALDGTNLLPSLAVRYLVSDSSIAKVDSKLGIVTGISPGEVTIRVMTTYYGVTKTDSLRMTIGNPVSAKVSADVKPSPTVANEYVRVFNPSSITIGVGGTIQFAQSIFLSGPELGMDVVFDDPSAAQPSAIPQAKTRMETGSGNIGPLPSLVAGGAISPTCLANLPHCAGATRSFPVAGTYHYHSDLFGTSGVIIVKGP